MLLGVAAPAPAQLPPRMRQAARDYFPLAVGNQWVYVQRGPLPGRPLAVEVTFAGQFNGLTYFELSGFAGQKAWVRQTPAGDLVQYDPASRSERLWYAFGGSEGFSWRSELPLDCVGRATVMRRAAEVRVPAGNFPGALLIGYPPHICADAGLEMEAFAPGVGLLRRSEQTIAGPRTYELASARLNGVTIAGPGLTFSLSIDRPVYFADFMPPLDPARSTPVMQARLTIRNTSSTPVTLHFSSGQRYDLAIRDESGKQVFLWSEGQAFTRALGQLELGQSEETFPVEMRLAGKDGRPLPEARYKLEAWLTTSGDPVYTATVPFELRHVF